MSACTVVKLSGSSIRSNRTEDGVRSKMEQRQTRKKRNQEEKLPSGSHRYQKGAEKNKRCSHTDGKEGLKGEMENNMNESKRTHMNFQNHSCLLPLMTSDTRNLKERRGVWGGRRRKRKGGVAGTGEG